MIIYIDQFLFTDFCMNLLIIKVTKNILRTDVSNIKMMLFSTVSTLISVSVFIPGLPYTFLTALFSLAMLLLTFKPKSIINAVRIIIVFFAVTFASAGCSYMIINLTDTYNLIIILLTTTVFTYTVIGIIGEIYEKHYKYDTLKHKIKIVTDNKAIIIDCYYDTGNYLIDPVSKMPVVITGIKPIRNILPESLTYRVLHNDNITDIYCTYADKIKLRLIPYRTVGSEGLLLGFVPDKMYLDEKEFEGIIGISNNAVHLESKDSAILNPALII